MAKGPLGSQNCTWFETFNFGDLRQVRTCQTEAFFSKLLCLARMLRNETKADQHGSGSGRSPKTALGCTFSILAICDRSGRVNQRPFFSFFFFETILFILDYILRPRSVLPPFPVEDLCSACISIKIFYIQY